jgi:endo-1,4-beta-xylanase
MFRGLLLSSAVIALGCTTGGPDQSQTESYQTTTAALTAPIVYDFEDGSTNGWFPFGSPTLTNSTEVAFSGTHSLKTTNRTSGFMGPATSLTGQLTAGTIYNVSVKARLAAGEAPTSVKITMMRTQSDGSNLFEQVAPSINVTDQGWVTLSGSYSFTGTATGLILYVESASATASYYIDAFSLSQGPAPLSYDFEDGTTQGWGPFGNPTLTARTAC